MARNLLSLETSTRETLITLLWILKNKYIQIITEEIQLSFGRDKDTKASNRCWFYFSIDGVYNYLPVKLFFQKVNTMSSVVRNIKNIVQNLWSLSACSQILRRRVGKTRVPRLILSFTWRRSQFQDDYWSARFEKSRNCSLLSMVSYWKWELPQCFVKIAEVQKRHIL